MNLVVTNLDARHREVLEANGCLAVDAVSYIDTHYPRFRETLSFLSALGPRRILELGANPPFAFSALLADVFPEASLTMAQNADQPARDYFGELSGERTIELRARPAPDRAFEARVCPIRFFNAERDVWPWEAGSFDLVLCMEIVEHLLFDPCFLFRQCHRVLEPGGRMLVTTPNLACLESLHWILHQQSPYRFGNYTPHGEYGRHNREFVPRDLILLCESSGFDTEQLTTRDIYPIREDLTRTQALLTVMGGDPALRLQNIFYLGRKQERPFGPYPWQLYSYNPSEHTATIQVLEAAAALAPGDRLRVRARVSNGSNYEWREMGDGEDSTRLGVLLLDEAGEIRKRDFVRVPLPDPVPPGGSADLEFEIEDPGGGAFILKLDMVHERVCWFSELTNTASRATFVKVRRP